MGNFIFGIKRRHMLFIVFGIIILFFFFTHLSIVKWNSQRDGTENCYNITEGLKEYVVGLELELSSVYEAFNGNIDQCEKDYVLAVDSYYKALSYFESCEGSLKKDSELYDIYLLLKDHTIVDNVTYYCEKLAYYCCGQ